MRTFAQPGGGAKKVLETRSHLDRGRTMSFEKLCRVLATGHGDPCASPAPASTRRPLEPLACFKFRFLRRPQIAPFWMHEAWLEAMRRIVDLLDTLTAAPAEALESQ